MVPAECIEPLTVTGHSPSGELVLAVPLVRRAGRTSVEYAFLGVTDYACPQCANLLLIASHPSLEQVRQAAASGNEEAQQQLAIVEEALQRFPPNSDR